MKILLLNMEYAMGLTGKIREYFVHPLRVLRESKDVQMKTLDKIKGMIHREQPDVCCLKKKKKGSFWDHHINQLQYLRDKSYKYGSIHNKYGPRSKLRTNPFFEGRSNGFISKVHHTHRVHYFKEGTKKLIYDIALQDKLKLQIAHFSLNKKVRAEQIEELAQTKGPVILCGDFNIMKGVKEVEPLLQAGFTLANNPTDYTFPSYKPKKLLDLFMLKGIQKKKCYVLPDKVSDHRAVILEI